MDCAAMSAQNYLAPAWKRTGYRSRNPFAEWSAVSQRELFSSLSFCSCLFISLQFAFLTFWVQEYFRLLWYERICSWRAYWIGAGLLATTSRWCCHLSSNFSSQKNPEFDFDWKNSKKGINLLNLENWPPWANLRVHFSKVSFGIQECKCGNHIRIVGLWRRSDQSLFCGSPLTDLKFKSTDVDRCNFRVIRFGSEGPLMSERSSWTFQPISKAYFQEFPYLPVALARFVWKVLLWFWLVSQLHHPPTI